MRTSFIQYMRSRREVTLGLFVLALGVSVSYAIVVNAQTSAAETAIEEAAVEGIAFPVSELGNCGDKEACARYCNDTANMPSCIAFAKAHGLMNAEEAQRAEKFHARIRSAAGPGGCSSPRDCEAYCRDIANIEACVKFAEEQGFTDRHVEEGKKMLIYLKAGGSMPGDCTSKESCERYCGDFSHVEECYQFAQRAGITQVRGEVPGEARGRFEGDIPPGQFQKFIELTKRGETPGGCTSKDACETYCGNKDHFEECVTFGEKVGFIEPAQAAKIRQTGGFGPGGCNSPQACQSYCNDPANQEACFKFAEEHGFIKKEEIARAKEGFVQLRAGLEQAPPEIAACLKSVLGSNIIEDIQSGKLVPGPEIGDRVRVCHEKFGQHGGSRELFSGAPPEVTSCLKEKLGDTFEKVRSGEAVPTPEMADTFRVCFNQAKFFEGGVPGAAGGFAPGAPGEPSHNINMFYEFLRTAPPGIAECLQRQLGDDYARLKSGEVQPGPDFKEKVTVCFGEYKPMEQHRFKGEGKPTPLPFPVGSGNTSGLSPQVLECVKSVAGAGAVERLQRGETAGEVGDALRACMEKLRSDVRPKTGICPAMPSVTECSAGEVRTVVFQSPECGVYYGCKESGTTLPPRTDGTVCAQVITPAQNPTTGECKKFPTPCDVPQGWKHGCEGTSSGGFETDPAKLLNTFIAPIAPAPVCTSEEECKRVCSDTAHPSYKTAECEKWRSAVR